MGFPYLLSLLCQLQEARIEHSLEHLDRSILVLAHTETQRWEIRIFEEERVEVTIFHKDPNVFGPDKLIELLQNPPVSTA